MIIYDDRNILASPRVDIVVYQMNCINDMNHGLPRRIRKKYPEILELEEQTKRGDIEKLGTYSLYLTKDRKKMFLKMYSTYSDKRHHHDNLDYGIIKNIYSEVIRNYSGMGYTLGVELDPKTDEWTEMIGIINQLFTEAAIDIIIARRK